MAFESNDYKPSILLVDDSPDSLQVMMEILREENYEIRPVISGEQAIAAAHHSPPDLILLDVRMPDLDGYEVCRRLKSDARTREIPIVFLTAMDMEDEEEKGFSLGALDYIIKPPKTAILKARVRSQIQLKLSRDKLEQQAEELRSTCSELEAFSYSVSHDLKSPLNMIKTYMSYILQSLEKSEDTQSIEDAQEVMIATEHMNQIIDDLMQLSTASHEALVMEPVDLSLLSACVIEDMKRVKPDRVIAFSCESDIKVIADSHLMRIAMKNILQNAWKYTTERRAARIEFGAVKYEDETVYFVKDNGIGFDMKYSSELFTAFSRLENAKDYEGTGIGLAIVDRIIARHGGKVWATGELGKGSTIHFTLGKR